MKIFFKKLNLKLNHNFSCQIENWAKLFASIIVGRKRKDMTFGGRRRIKGINKWM